MNTKHIKGILTRSITSDSIIDHIKNIEQEKFEEYRQEKKPKRIPDLNELVEEVLTSIIQLTLEALDICTFVDVLNGTGATLMDKDIIHSIMDQNYDAFVSIADHADYTALTHILSIISDETLALVVSHMRDYLPEEIMSSDTVLHLLSSGRFEVGICSTVGLELYEDLFGKLEYIPYEDNSMEDTPEHILNHFESYITEIPTLTQEEILNGATSEEEAMSMIEKVKDQFQRLRQDR